MAEHQKFLEELDQISLEKAIINHLLTTWNAQLLLEMQLKDIKDEYFVDETHMKIYQFMKNYYSDTKLVPVPSLIEDTFSNFFWLETTYDVQAHIEELIFRWEKRITTENMKKALAMLNSNKIPTDVFQETISTLATPRSWKKIVWFLESAKEYKEKYLHEMQHKELFDKGIKTGIKEFDYMTGWIQPTDYIWILAREWVWKTIFNLWLSYNALKQGKNVIFFSPEMSEDQIKQRLVLMHNNFDVFDFKNKNLAEEDIEKWNNSLETLSEDFKNENSIIHPELYIVDDIPENNFSMKTIAAKVERYNQIIRDKIKSKFSDRNHKDFIDKENYIDLIVIDWFQNMKPSEKLRVKDSWEKWKSISNQIKSFALINKIPIVTSFHANRWTEDKLAPDLYNAALTDAIWRDLDVWFSLFRTEMMMNAKFLWVSILKVREGSPFNFLMHWDLDKYKISYAKKIGSLDSEADKLGWKKDEKDGWKKKNKKEDEEWDEKQEITGDQFLEKFKEKEPKKKKDIIKKEEPKIEEVKPIEEEKHFDDEFDSAELEEAILSGFWEE